MKVDLSVVAQVTEKCNLRCTYCYLDRGRPLRDMNPDVAEWLVVCPLNNLKYNTNPI